MELSTVRYILILTISLVSVKGSPVEEDLLVKPRSGLKAYSSSPEVYKCLKEGGLEEKVVERLIETDADGFARLDIGDDKNWCMYACYLKDELGKELSRHLRRTKAGQEMEQKCKAEDGSSFCTYTSCMIDKVTGVRHNAIRRLTLQQLL